MTVEEFFKHRGWSGTQHLYKDAEDYGKLMYNKALEDAAENAETEEEPYTYCQECGNGSKQVDKQSILKLKKL